MVGVHLSSLEACVYSACARADEGLRLVGELAGYAEIADAIEALPGVVTHGLFVGVATSAVIPTPDGPRVLHRVRIG